MKIHKTIGCRVIIDVEEPRFLKEDKAAADYLADATSIITDIKRHVDGCDSITYEMEEQDECSFCGAEWEVYSEEDEVGAPYLLAGMPVCCVRAREEWIENQKEND